MAQAWIRPTILHGCPGSALVFTRHCGRLAAVVTEGVGMTAAEFMSAVNDYRAVWIRQAKGLLGDHRDAAEDVVQALIAELSAFNADKAVYRYEPLGHSDITRLVEYRVTNFLNREAEDAQATPEDGDDSEAGRFKRGNVTISWVMESTEAYQQQLDIRAALAELPHRQRYVAAMVLVEGHTMEEVGVRLGVNKMKVSRILEQAKEALRDSLSAYGGE
jgi:RNA polymerase sigma factor (sigma-70 family)